jgi:Uma2 family endonuclease
VHEEVLEMATAARRWTWASYSKLPDDGKQYEVLEGRLVLNPAPIIRHEFIRMGVVRALLLHLEKHPDGRLLSAPVDVVLSRYDICQPDLLFLRRERLRELDVDGPFRGAPDLVIEILSPSTSKRDRVVKKRIYERTGVGEYWIVDPRQPHIEQLRLSGKRYLEPVIHGAGSRLTTPLLPAFELDVDALYDLSALG